MANYVYGKPPRKLKVHKRQKYGVYDKSGTRLSTHNTKSKAIQIAQQNKAKYKRPFKVIDRRDFSVVYNTK